MDPNDAPHNLKTEYVIEIASQNFDKIMNI